MAHCPQINNTTIIGTSAVSYDSTPLPCTDVKACDDLNTILTKFDNVICSAIDSVNNLSEDIMNITEDLMIITEEIENINNQIFICCPICDFTVTATELPVCQFTATANELPDSTTTTTTSTSSGGSTTTTTTLFPPSRNTTPVFNDAGFICLHPYDTLQCGFNPECVSYYYDLITCPNLTVGCTLYTDIGLTNVFTTAFDDYFYSDGFGGQVSYQISASGQIVNILPCPTPPPLAQYCSSCVAVNIDGTSFNVGGGVTATCTYTGDVRNYPNPYPVQYTLDTFPANCAWLGRDRNPFTLTLNFSQPITSINIYQGGGDLKENYTFNTNTGVPTLTPILLSYITIQGNLIYSNSPRGGGLSSSLLVISNTTPFTSLTISGWTGPFPGRPVPSGSVFAICTQLA